MMSALARADAQRAPRARARRTPAELAARVRRLPLSPSAEQLRRWLLTEGLAYERDAGGRLLPTSLALEIGEALDR
jgi:hypothetical protein